VLTDEELIINIRQGDRRAAEELVERHQQKAYAIAYHYLGGRDDAEDATQEAFLRAFRSLDSFRGDAVFYTWFYRILIHTCIDQRRRHRRWRRIFSRSRPTADKGRRTDKRIEEQPDERTCANPQTVLRSKQLSQDIEEALLQLPEKQRLVFQLKVFHGLRIREIAEIMQNAEGTVKSHLFRATQVLRTALKEWAQPEAR